MPLRRLAVDKSLCGTRQQEEHRLLPGLDQRYEKDWLQLVRLHQQPALQGVVSRLKVSFAGMGLDPLAGARVKHR